MSRPNLKSLGGCKPRSAIDRFHESYIPEPNSGCWLWLGTIRGSNEYGAIKVDGKTVAAHRFSWTIHNGEIPDCLLVLHRCDTPACVNPNHLFLGNHADNQHDKMAKGRIGDVGTKTPLLGRMNARAKLTDEIVLSIRGDARSQREIASAHGISQCLVHNIKARKTWRHI